MSQKTQYLFTPPNGQSYNDDDWKILCKSTPISFDQLPEYLRHDRQVPGYIRPFLVCCWLEGEEKLEKLYREHFPQCASLAREVPGGELTEDVLSSITETQIFMSRKYGVPQDKEDCFVVINAVSPDGEETLSLVVGDTRYGLIPLGIIRTLADEYFDGRMPAWYIMRHGWKWERKPKVNRPKRGPGNQHAANKQTEGTMVQAISTT